MGRGDFMNENYNEYALLFKALSDPNRLLIIEFLIDGERCACKILDQLEISQSTLSYHMKILCESEIVTGRKECKWMHYSLHADKLDVLVNLLVSFNKTK
jgi:ArsR family transcriptional regulator